ncbi:hypothetical protein Cni_G01763 [Canna indica]|uniref:Uncharacterized protein n=1 Tax=Canna indica TaxID=4628 RepID=A0AAQ3Q1D2_9LILI|nr:hypothetical protein Cni_G01763 [Canna indica]
MAIYNTREAFVGGVMVVTATVLRVVCMAAGDRRVREAVAKGGTMKVLLATAFTAAPLMLYLPPMRNLNSFMEAVQTLSREVAGYWLSGYLRFQRGVRRIVVLITYALR